MPDQSGLVSQRSQYDVGETERRLRAAVDQAGLTLFAGIDHGANAQDAGLTLRPTRLLIFGNGRGGTPLMQLRQTAGLDLPLKALVWQDETGAVWVSYNDLRWLADRHGLGAAAEAPIAALSAGLAKLVQMATG